MTVNAGNRRDLLLMGCGLAIICAGSVADSAFNGTSSTDRQALDAAVARLNDIPAEIGDWVSTDSELSAHEVEVAGIEGYIRREYHNQRTGFRVYVTVLCGPAGPMAVHPPTACFQGVGYTLLTGPTLTTVKSDDDPDAARPEFNKCTFKQSNASVPELVRVFWGWSRDGKWSAPSGPRLVFRGQPYLYKLYIVDRWLEDTGQHSLPQIESFMTDALPYIEAALDPERPPLQSVQNDVDANESPVDVTLAEESAGSSDG